MSNQNTSTPDGFTAKQRELFESLLHESGLGQTRGMRPRPDSQSWPLSFAQQRLWFLDQMEPGSPAYNNTVAIRLKGELNPGVLEHSLQEITRRHEVLRSRIKAVEGAPVQVIDRGWTLTMPVKDLTRLPAGDRESEVRRITEAESLLPISLADGPLMRVLLLRLETDHHVLVMSIHHIAIDGWSQGVFAAELAALYAAFSQGENSPLPDLPIQYADYAHWQAEWIGAGKCDEELSYWEQRLRGAPAFLDLPTDHPRPRTQTTHGARYHFTIPALVADAMRALSRRRGVTTFMSFLAAFKVLLCMYTGQEDIVVGTPIAGRNRSETEGLIGLFLNTLVLRTSLAGDPTFSELLDRTKQTALGAYAHQDVPFERLVEFLNPERDLSRSPLFQTMFILQVPAEPVPVGDLRVEVIDTDACASKFDLTLFLHEYQGTIHGHFEYSTDLFERSTIERMYAHFSTLLESVIENADRPMSSLNILGDGERRRILGEWNNLERPFSGCCVHELIEAQAQQTPDAVALAFGNAKLTYAELNKRANQFARRLGKLGASPGKFIALCVDRSADMVAQLLGILKTGAAYVPLDPAYPAERLAFMLADSEAHILITESRFQDLFGGYRGEVVTVDADHSLAAESSEPVVNAARPEDLAYVIYTSGSTGKPKGVMIPHRALVNLLESMQREPGLQSDDVLLAVTTLSFDIAGLELYLPLLAGARVEIVSREVAIDGRRLIRELERSGATVMQATPATWRMLIEAGWKGDGRLKVLCGGEAMPRALAEQLLERAGSVWNVYGPTETTIWSTVAQVISGSGPVLIGRPIANTTVYILDRNGKPVPPGVVGELHIGGVGLARGYWRRQELTAEKFIANPVPGRQQERIYRTGDLARYRADGQIECLGRIDHQVKLRGYRIELGEIESALATCPGVRQAVVTVREEQPGDLRLAGYIVVLAGHTVRVDHIRQSLKQTLPEHMVPSAIVVLDALPLTPNGKIDRKALPAPAADHASSDNYIPPASELESRIAEIWRDVLRVQSVGRNDNFFDVGGHSLLLTQVHSRLSRSLGKDLTIIDLFRHPTFASLAAFLQPDAESRADASSTNGAQRTKRDDEPIAIVGMAGRFPGAAGVEELWENLRQGLEGVRFFSREEMLARGADAAAVASPNFVPAGAVLDDADLFDAAYFGFTPREAEITDPQHRVFLECAHQALENAGYDPQRWPGRIGVYAGCGMNTYLIRNLARNPDALRGVGAYQTFLSNDKDFIATRVSYKLNLTGPSVNVQTACSTSLVAVHMACRSLIDNECDIALAGGVSVSAQQGGYLYQEEGIFSPDGHCRPFDASARGTFSGNGAAIVVLKRLTQAIEDRDTIHAVILASAMNNDGSRKVGYTAPSVEGQAAVIAEAQVRAGVTADSITCVEAHGTGTALGDPIEIAALTEAFRRSTDANNYCAIGSLKSNMGHLDTAAGAAGLIKAVMQIEHAELVPSLNYEQPNPNIDFANSPFFVNTHLKEWRTAGRPRRAGVSSFGIGGTNVHVVLEQAPEPVKSGPSRSCQVLLTSAKTPAALEKSSDNLAAWFRRTPGSSLADVAYTTQAGRMMHAYRRVVVCSSTDEALERLETLHPEHVWTGREAAVERPVVFVFPGQGSQYPGMARDLYGSEERFRQEVDRCTAILRPCLDGVDLREVLFGGAAFDINETRFAQPALFVIEYGLARVWMDWGVQPQALAGHSIGEYVAACLAGVMNLEDALLLVAARGRLMQSAAPGVMLAVDAGEQIARRFAGGSVDVAAINGPALCVLSGSESAITQIESQLRGENITCRRLHTSHAFHSPAMDAVLAGFAGEVRKVQFSKPRIPFVSNLSGTWIRPEEAIDPRYWVRHLRECVRFSDVIDQICTEPRTIIELGPGQALSALFRRHPARTDKHAVYSSMRHPHENRPDVECLLTALARYWVDGGRVDWDAFSTNEKRRRVPIPTYPFERQRFWVDPASTKPAQSANQLTRKGNIDEWFHVPVWQYAAPARLRRSPNSERARWVLFADTCGVATAASKELAAAGHEIVIVRAASAFANLNGSGYSIDPGAREHYTRLFAEIGRRDPMPLRIGHFWSVTRDLPSPGAAQALGYHSLLFIARALAEGNPGIVQLAVVTNHVQAVTGAEPLSPDKAMVCGPCITISQEYPNLSCRAIDIDMEGQVTEDLGRRVALELGSTHSARFSALRGSQLLVRRFERVVLDRVEGRPASLRDHGVYLITGGTGKIGSCFARYLAKTVQARLILIGRSELAGNESAQRAVEQCERDGGLVTFVRAEVSDVEQMKSVVAKARDRFGRIDGVIHCAGIMSPDAFRALADTDAAASSRHFGPKVHGLLALEAALRGMEPDFCLLASSISTVLGGLGFTAYSAANIYMDTFARSRNRDSNLQWTSINWDAWEFGGNPAHPKSGIAALALSPDQGAQVLERVLNRLPVDQVIVSTADLAARIEQWVEPSDAAAAKAAVRSAHSRAPGEPAEMRNRTAASADEVESQVLAIWEDLLGVQSIGVHANFFELGGHSLLATQVLSRIREAFQVSLSLRILFEAPTPSKLAAAIRERLTPDSAVASPPITAAGPEPDLLARLDQLSEEDISELLKTMTSGDET